jgi:hypothetical protein
MHEGAVSKLMCGAFVFLCASQSLSAPVLMLPVQVDEIGDCKGGEKSYDLRRVMILANKSIDIVDDTGRDRVSINGDEVNIEALASKQGAYVVKLPYKIENGANLDIEASLAFLNGELLVYWKETLQHHIFKQGLFRITGQRLEFVCEGRGGVTASH